MYLPVKIPALLEKKTPPTTSKPPPDHRQVKVANDKGSLTKKLWTKTSLTPLLLNKLLLRTLQLRQFWGKLLRQMRSHQSLHHHLMSHHSSIWKFHHVPKLLTMVTKSLV